jgi:hypothetical protein
MILFGVFTIHGDNMIALFRNQMDAKFFVSQASPDIPLYIVNLDASDASKMWDRS